MSKINMKDETRKKALKEFINSIKTKHGTKIDRIILFGSYGRGDYRKESDIDVLVIWKGNEIEGWNSLEREAVEVLFKYGSFISLKIISPDEFSAMKEMDFPFIKNVSAEGVVLG
ncbi:MAG: nucleotidyltransferase domain-containing protein [Candidatus Methanoperedens sp.]|nr:nucleotidyltransferase domain-containing protein [Candidatus Methanoperedens sp.]MCZ7361032.1 nucleotidyltransferase domain-containing protein [Candidatus Methanoperedens sp.]HLB71190.1 nucleotidyltransferase domain-containing protein [Candidatus Methanoperedens sp.]